jgi:hypothetical protein
MDDGRDLHRQAIRHGDRVVPGLFSDTYVLYRENESGHLHGNAVCGTSPQHPVHLSVAEILALSSTGEECECGGWRSTAFFPALLIAHRSWELHRIVEDGGIGDVPEALEQIDRMQPWWRPDLENVGVGLAAAAQLARENYHVELDLLTAFAERLDPHVLLRYVGAHGLRIESDVEGAREFSAWVDGLNPRVMGERSLRLSRPPAHVRRDRQHRRFDELLEQALTGPRSLVLIERRLWSPLDGATWRTPAEVLLLSLSGGHSARTSFGWFELPEAVVAGLHVLLGPVAGPPRLGVVAGSRLPEKAVREVTESLWVENDGTWQDLAEMLVAASALADA